MIGLGHEKRTVRTFNFNPVWIILLLGFLLTAYVYQQMEENNRERLQKSFDIDAGHAVTMIRNRLEDHLIDLDALQRFYNSSDEVRRDEFTAFVRPTLAARSGILAFAWIPRIAGADRAGFETAIGRPISELDQNARLIPAPGREFHYVTIFSEPPPASADALGYDLGADPVRRTALEKAGDSNAAIATAPLRLLHETNVQYGLLVFKPVYQKGMPVKTVTERRAALRGYVSAIFRSSDIVWGAVTADQLADLAITISDVSDSETGQILFRSQPAESPTSSRWLPAIANYRDDFTFAGRPWRIEIDATPGYISSRTNLSHRDILPVGGLLTLILAFIVHSLYGEISRRRGIEAALHASQGELVAKNSELAHALAAYSQAQVRLIQQEKLAGIGQLAAGVAHEINNPLGYVTANIEALAQNFDGLAALLAKYRRLEETVDAAGLPDAAAIKGEITNLENELDIDFIIADFPELVADTDEGLKRISRIVHGMRSFSRIAPGQVFENLDLNKCIENTLLIAHSEIKYHAEVVTAFAGLPAIEAIGGEIHQVLLNLIVNALHAITEKNPASLGTIKITTCQEGEMVACHIEDSGTGIPADNLGSIFNPFFTTKPLGQGTGLGLSICHDIVVNRHHGAIDVASTPGEGAKFTFKLPIKQKPPVGE